MCDILCPSRNLLFKFSCPHCPNHSNAQITQGIALFTQMLTSCGEMNITSTDEHSTCTLSEVYFILCTDVRHSCHLLTIIATHKIKAQKCPVLAPLHLVVHSHVCGRHIAITTIGCLK